MPSNILDLTPLHDLRDTPVGSIHYSGAYVHNDARFLWSITSTLTILDMRATAHMTANEVDTDERVWIKATQGEFWVQVRPTFVFNPSVQPMKESQWPQIS